MENKEIRGRALKKKVRELLVRNELQGLAWLPLKLTISPLVSFLCSGDEILKWRAVAGLGLLAEQIDDMDFLKVVMRRMMWHLNDESGGIGWGAPEAMAEIMRANKSLVSQYAKILISYITEGPNFLEHNLLRRGAYWGIVRLSEKYPEFLDDAALPLLKSLESKDSFIRGLSALALGRINEKKAVKPLNNLINDNNSLTIFNGQELINTTVSEEAQAALKKISSSVATCQQA